MSYFTNLTDFLTMHGYACFVWPAWLITLIAWLILASYAWWQQRHVYQRIIIKQQRAMQLAETYRHNSSDIDSSL